MFVCVGCVWWLMCPQLLCPLVGDITFTHTTHRVMSLLDHTRILESSLNKEIRKGLSIDRVVVKMDPSGNRLHQADEQDCMPHGTHTCRCAHHLPFPAVQKHFAAVVVPTTMDWILQGAVLPEDPSEAEDFPEEEADPIHQPLPEGMANANVKPIGSSMKGNTKQGPTKQASPNPNFNHVTGEKRSYLEPQFFSGLHVQFQNLPLTTATKLSHVIWRMGMERTCPLIQNTILNIQQEKQDHLLGLFMRIILVHPRPFV